MSPQPSLWDGDTRPDPPEAVRTHLRGQSGQAGDDWPWEMWDRIDRARRRHPERYPDGQWNPLLADD